MSPQPLDPMVGLRELRGCFYSLGRFSRERLFLATYASGKQAIVYPIYSGKHAVVYVDVEAL